MILYLYEGEGERVTPAWLSFARGGEVVRFYLVY